MIKKAFFFQHLGFNWSSAILTEGLLKNNINVFSTYLNNYGTLCDHPDQKNVEYFYSPRPPRFPSSWCATVNFNEFAEECKIAMDDADVIFMNEDSSITTAHIKNTSNGIQSGLFDYAINNHSDKFILLCGSDMSNLKITFDLEPNLKLIFKREKSLGNKDYTDKFFPFPYACEDRLFTGGKDFDTLWDSKNNFFCNLFDLDTHPLRKELADRIRETYSKRADVVIGTVYGGKDKEIEKHLNGPATLEDLSISFHSLNYLNTLLSSKISIDGMPGNNAFYTGRMFESLANGCCLFVPNNPNRVDFPNEYVNGEDWIVYNDVDDLMNKLDYYDIHQDELKDIARNAFNKTLTYHTTQKRVEQCLEVCNDNGL